MMNKEISHILCLAAATAGVTCGATGCGFLNSKISTHRETANEAKLMMRLSFMGLPVSGGSSGWRSCDGSWEKS